MILLTICIPTYNRRVFLESTLQSVVEQATEEVEVVISDSGSTDQTDALVHAFQMKYSFIRYESLPYWFSADKNFLRVISLSRGKYCWFLSSDDCIAPGAIEKVLNCLRADPKLSGLSLNRICYDVSMEQIIPSDFPSILRRNMLFNNSNECIEKLFTYFPFLSGQVVRKSYWDSILIETDVQRNFYSYIHVLIILKIVRKYSHWMYLHDPLIKCRLGNDSFLGQGYYNRFEMDAVGFSQIIREEAFFRRLESKIVSRLLRIVVASHIIRAVLHLKDRSLMKKMICKAFVIYKSYPAFWLYIAWWWGVPSICARCLRFIYRITLKPFRTQTG